ncbi:hypothetical protein ANN_09503 [Periplaneta americana]|uniref:Uncharacterized protein n=1 Tax=Periplaneta americana TaxID=6978 RepID=A0ABQ8TNJ3_PERAM|nr:hypothetical protein ANN_09503 [Periplaneta americana]
MFEVRKVRFPYLSVGLKNKLDNAPNIIYCCLCSASQFEFGENNNLPEDDPNVMTLPYESVPVASSAQQSSVWLSGRTD